MLNAKRSASYRHVPCNVERTVSLIWDSSFGFALCQHKPRGGGGGGGCGGEGAGNYFKMSSKGCNIEIFIVVFIIETF